MRTGYADFIEEGYARVCDRVADDVYARSLDGLVLACVDVVVVEHGDVLLGRRTRHPQRDWWLIGGRMRPAETVAGAGARLVQHEAGLDVCETRFAALTLVNAAWRLRAQPPVSNGVHTLSVVMLLHVDEDERRAIRLNEEYAGATWRPASAIAEDVTLHGALRHVGWAVSRTEDRP